MKCFGRYWMSVIITGFILLTVCYVIHLESDRVTVSEHFFPYKRWTQSNPAGINTNSHLKYQDLLDL